MQQARPRGRALPSFTHRFAAGALVDRHGLPASARRATGSLPASP